MLLAQLEEFCHLLQIPLMGRRGEGVIDTCLQIELAVFLLQLLGDKDDVDAWETLVQESDVFTVFLRVALFVRIDVLYRSRMPSMTFVALLQDETAMNMPPVTLLKWSIVARLLPM